MTEKTPRKAVIINNIDSDTIDQAIFILKSDSPSKSLPSLSEKSIAAEAQLIIDSYIRQVNRIKDDYPQGLKMPQKKSRLKGTALFMFAAICFLCLGAGLFLINALN